MPYCFSFGAKYQVKGAEQFRDRPKFLADRMDAKARTETGWHKNEALRSVQAVWAFQDTFKQKSLKKYALAPAPKNLSVKISGLKLNVSIDAVITQEHKGITFAGGLILKYVFGVDRSSVGKELANAVCLL